MEKKITKREMYNAIIALAKGEDYVIDVTEEDLIAFCTKEIEALDRKAAKAKETAAKKKAEADALTDVIANVLTDEFEIIADITKKIDDEEVSNSKVGYRLNKLVEMGIAEKSEVSVGGGEGSKARKLVAFRKVQA